MRLHEAIERLNEARGDINIGRYVYSAISPGHDLTQVENSLYFEYKKKGVGAKVAIEHAAPGTKRFIYTIKRITPDNIELSLDR